MINFEKNASGLAYIDRELSSLDVCKPAGLVGAFEGSNDEVSIDFETFNDFQDIDKNRDFNTKLLIKFYRNYYRCLLCYI